ncbi:hypothetical protein Sala_2570 [Sphingopyxis alaskensis RB2256]|uniref:Uncharacterized protein n=1 Tax=Sphingopyxis alaskensis (strain DSM 13593 / LMG 18877 / RB2256) TaxID=317655 RepID=Q1GPZ6_SPHAL|nr:hypothetical protein Sala_2570 [Sphingopyxis alaskensis RB2256]
MQCSLWRVALGWAKVWRYSRAKSTGATRRPDCRTLRISGCSHLGSGDLERRDTHSCSSARSGFAQFGKRGSLIDIEESWLHPRGRCSPQLCIAALLDSKDPIRVLGRLARPLIEQRAGDRDDHGPNVVYSYGGSLRGRMLLPTGTPTTVCGVPMSSSTRRTRRCEGAVSLFLTCTRRSKAIFHISFGPFSYKLRPFQRGGIQNENAMRKIIWTGLAALTIAVPTSAMAQHHDDGYRGGYGDEVLDDRGHGYREPEPYYRHSDRYAYAYPAYPAHRYERPYRYDSHRYDRHDRPRHHRERHHRSRRHH